MKGKIRSALLKIVVGVLMVGIGVAAAQLWNAVGNGHLTSPAGITVVLNSAAAAMNGPNPETTCTATLIDGSTFSIEFLQVKENSQCDLTLNMTNTGTAIAEAGIPVKGGTMAPYFSILGWDHVVPAGGTVSELIRLTGVGGIPDDLDGTFTLTLPLTPQ